MKISLFFLISLLVPYSLVAAESLPDTLVTHLDDIATQSVTFLARKADALGAWLKICRAPAPDALKGAWSNFVGQVKDGLFESAVENLADNLEYNSNVDLPYAPVTRFVHKHITEAKIVFGASVLLITAFVIKKCFFSKRPEESNDD